MNDQLFPALLVRVAVRALLLGCAVLLFAASVWWDNAANRGIDAPSSPPIPFTTEIPRGGVNTYNLHAEVVFRPDGSLEPQNNVRRTFEMIAAAGIRWVRVQFPWEDIEVGGKNNFVDTRPASKGADTWAKYDYIVSEARRNGIELLVRLDTPPDWARKTAIASPEIQAARAAGRYPLTGPPDRFEDFGDFAATVAKRYRNDVRFFQIWNEPNLPGEWNYRKQEPTELVALLRIARDRIKAVNPEAVIVFPALAPTDGHSDGVNDLDYLQGVYDAGGRDLFDIMSAQLYGLGQPPTEHRYIRPGSSLLQPIETKADVGRIVLLREIMERNGDTNKAIWISEFGWNSAPESLGEAALRWGEPVSEQTKGDYLVQAMQRAQQEWPWMGPMNIWMFRFGGPAPDPRDPTPYFQLVDFDFNPLPAYETVRSYLTDPAGLQLPPARRSPLATTATIVSAASVVAAGVWLFPTIIALLTAAITRARPRRRIRLARPRWSDNTALMVTLLAATLAFFYWGSTFQERAQLPISAFGAIIFFGLTLLRPDLSLLFVLVTVPLYLAPKGIWDEEFGVRPAGILFPLHEFVLLCVAAASVLHIVLWQQERLRQLITPWIQQPLATLRHASIIWPILLFLIAGTLGVLVAAARGAALREWRWLIIEPLLFYGLTLFWSRNYAIRHRLVWAWLVTGVAVALIGLLQIVGLDLTALLPQSSCFSDRVVLAEGGLQRISSVYCHPNNLGLALGRVWPVLAALAIGQYQILSANHHTSTTNTRFLLLASGALVCLAALGASFSKGAIAGAFVALLVLGLSLGRQYHRWRRSLLGLGVGGAICVALLGIAFDVERLNPFGGSSGARLELWTAALNMMRDHPLTGVGLDQFYHYRNAPELSDRYIDPTARATTEQFAAHPHNLLLDIPVRLGPLGLIAMSWLVVHFWRVWQARRTIGESDSALIIGLGASMAAALAHGLVDNFYFVPDLAFVFWLLLALVGLSSTPTEAADMPHLRERTSSATKNATETVVVHAASTRK